MGAPAERRNARTSVMVHQSAGSWSVVVSDIDYKPTR
jgi:hypothetical protein